MPAVAISRDQTIRDIPVEKIDVLNPRSRDETVYMEIERSIKAVGLKKPITVAIRRVGETERYLLICGEGRLRAFRALGQPSIPAQIIDAAEEDAFLMSLAENIARRQYKPLELLSGIKRLRDRGCKVIEISRLTGLSTTYLGGVLMLLNHGEDRLLRAVERGQIPLYAAMAIYKGSEPGKHDDLNQALADAVAAGDLRPSEVAIAKKVALQRRDQGKAPVRKSRAKTAGTTPSSLIRTYKQQLAKQDLVIKNSSLAEQRLAFFSGAMATFLRDEKFAAILAAEGLTDLPDYLARQITSAGEQA